MSRQAEAVKQYFFANGIKQADITEKIGAEQSTVSNLLAGRRPFNRKWSQKLHDAYGFSIPFLMLGVGELFDHPSRTVHEVSNSTITQGDNSPINITADNAALQAENETLKKENEWLRGMVESLSKK